MKTNTKQLNLIISIIIISLFSLFGSILYAQEKLQAFIPETDVWQETIILNQKNLSELIINNNKLIKTYHIIYKKPIVILEEEPAKIESWMSNPNFWDDLILQEKEAKIESWMSDTNFWNDLLPVNIPNYEEESKIEQWMLDINYWDNETVNLEGNSNIEDWMSATDYWNKI